jgi:3-dehydroquinate dehydratase-2
MKKVLVLHGPNLNLLGIRENTIYGSTTLKEVNSQLQEAGKKVSIEIRAYQSNSEGELIDALHDARTWADGVIFNPGGYTHTSVALRDAVAAIDLPVIEVHLSNISSRESFRHASLIAPECIGQISGFGWQSYLVALHGLVLQLKA